MPIKDVEIKTKLFVLYALDFFAFCKQVLGYKDLITEHEQLCKFMQDKSSKNKLILMPRYSFKSSIVTIGYSLWRLTLDDSIRILIYSDATSKAEGFLTSIKNHITGVDKTSGFKPQYGSWETDPKQGTWNQSAIIVRTRQHAHAEPSVDTAGIETSKVGAHYDLIIFDDIVSDKNTTTKEQMDKVSDCYKNALSLLKPGGEIIIVGTRWHFGDLYGRLLAENETSNQFTAFIKQAEINDQYPFEQIGLTKDFLSQQRRNQGSYKFSCLYQNQPVDDETATFKAKDFTFYQPPVDRTGLYITCCIDPAISQNQDSDDTAITVVGSDDEYNMYLLEIVAGHLLPDDIINESFSLHQKWKFNTLGLETNAFQKMLRRDFEYRLKQERKQNPKFNFFQIAEFTGTSRNTKELRIRALQPYHERGAIKFPGQRLELLQGKYLDLAYQMLQFPNAPHDDILDSLAYHVQIQRQGGKVVRKDIPHMSPAWLERREYEQEIRQNKVIPYWKRKYVAPLTFS